MTARSIFGQAALVVFVIGIMAAGISSHLPNMMVIPWISDDLAGRVRNTQTMKKRVLFFCCCFRRPGFRWSCRWRCWG